MDNKKIKQMIKDSGWDMTEPNNLALALLSTELEDAELIDFSIMFREDTSDSWLQIEYTNEKINRPIIIDYDFPQEFENANDFILNLELVNKQIENINKII